MIHNETIFATKLLSAQFFSCEHNIVLIQIRILDKGEKWTVKKAICSYGVTIFMNPFNTVHAFTELLKQRDYINNAGLQ